MPRSRPRRLALMWRGDPSAPERPASHATRLLPLMAALRAEGVEPEPFVYFDEDVEEARRRLARVDGVMVWINPLADGRDRTTVDALLRELAEQGVWVSAHPAAILAMGTKEVLFRTRHLGWGANTELHPNFEMFAGRFPGELVAGPRVLKPLRGNDGQGVLKVEAVADGAVQVQAASDDGVRTLPMAAFLDEMRVRFADGAALIDQVFQPNVAAGMVRCYMSLDRVVGFSMQSPRRHTDAIGLPAFGMDSAKTMLAADAPELQDLRGRMEQEWTPAMQRVLGLATVDLPALWDADFLHRPEPIAAGEPRFVLCEINVSSVSPFPEAAVPAVAATVARLLAAR